MARNGRSMAARHESGSSVTNLAAGTHAVQFSNLAAWKEPNTAEVLVIGGKQAEVRATYRSLPKFYFRDVPGQSVSVGKVPRAPCSQR